MKNNRITISILFIFLLFSVPLKGQNIFLAAYNGDFQTVRRLVEENPGLVNGKNDDGRFPLEMAAQTGQIEIVKYLLEKGADINLDRRGGTALHMAALYGGNTELIKLLLEKGADINAKTGNGDTPLNLALAGQQKEIAEMLLDEGGELNLENKNFTDIVYMAASTGVKRIVEMILNKDIDYSYVTASGNTLLHGAAEGGLVELAEVLLSKGLSIEVGNIYGQTPLHIAAKGGFKEIADLFLKKGADINIKTKNGKTPVHFAMENGQDELVEYLKNNGADPSDWKLPKLSGKYLDQEPPGDNPKIFAPGIVSEQEHFEHSGLTISPDYTEVFWVSDYTEFGFYDIVHMKKENGRWSAPELAPFVDKYHSGNPVISYDGKKLYFSSDRPRNENSSERDNNIWIVEKTGNFWSKPKLLDVVINTDNPEVVQSISRKGTLYFRRSMEFFSSNQKNGIFQNPVKVEIKAAEGDRIMALFIDPDENYMLLEIFKGNGGYGGGDIYVCYKLKDSSWSEPVNLGAKINKGGHERFPYVSPDGKYLFFMKVFDVSDIYWVDAKIIEDLNPNKLKLK